MTKNELIEYVKRQLGSPTVNVEITDAQINDAIQDAILEIKTYYTIFKYLTIDVTSSCIDLSEYNVLDVTDVIKVFDINSNDNEIIYDPFTYNGVGAGGLLTRYPMYATYKYSEVLNTRQNIHAVISSYANLYQEQFYNTLAILLQNRTNGMLYENISWKFYDNKLYIDTCYPHTSVVTIEYITNVREVEDFEEDTRYIQYLKQLSVAFSLLTQARVTGKYQVSNSPVSINYADMRSDAQSIIDKIREEIKLTSNRFYITD